MQLEQYQVWSRGLHVSSSQHHETDAASRLRSDDVIELFHQPKFKLPRSVGIFAIGSCFARNIEDAFLAKKFAVRSAEINLPPGSFGGSQPPSVLTKFNTHSMVTELQATFEDRVLPEDGLIEIRENLFWNPQLHRVGFVPRDVALSVKAAVVDTVRKIAECNLVIVTLGLTEYWFDNVMQVPLNDAPADWRHAKRTNRFEFRNSTFNESFEQVKQLADTIFRVAGPDARLVLTVSPVPLQRSFSNQDVIIANSYSKSVLRAIAQEISMADERIDYFPSYEIVTNSPRSVAWKQDMRHVEYKVIKAIVEKFEQTYFE